MKRSTFLKTLVAAPAAIKVVALGAKPQLGGIPITIEGTGSELIISESKGWQPTKRRGDLIFEYINNGQIGLVDLHKAWLDAEMLDVEFDNSKWVGVINNVQIDNELIKVYMAVIQA